MICIGVLGASRRQIFRGSLGCRHECRSIVISRMGEDRYQIKMDRIALSRRAIRNYLSRSFLGSEFRSFPLRRVLPSQLPPEDHRNLPLQILHLDLVAVMDTPNTPTMPNRNLRLFANGSQPYTPIRPSSTSSTWSSFNSIASSPSAGSTAFWKTPPKEKPFGAARFMNCRPSSLSPPYLANIRVSLTAHSTIVISNWKNIAERKKLRRFLPHLGVAVIFALLSISLFFTTPNFQTSIVQPDIHSLSAFQHTRPALPPTNNTLSDPIKWLAENSDNKYAVALDRSHFPKLWGDSRPRAAIISLVRNSELEGMMQSMRQLEYRWNGKYQVRLQPTGFSSF